MVAPVDLDELPEAGAPTTGRVNVTVTAVLLVCVLAIVFGSVRRWIAIFADRAPARAAAT